MKKLLVSLIAVCCLSPIALADNWGAGVKVGYGENDPKDLKALTGPYASSSLDEEGTIYGLEAFYEKALSNEKDSIGVKLGYELFGENEYSSGKEVRSGTTEEEWDFDAKEKTKAIPLTVYYKRDNGIKKLSYFAGAGVTWIRSKSSWSDKYEKEVSDVTVDESYDGASMSKSKIFPHIVLGTEYRFTKLFALGLEAKYNINAKVKKSGAVLSDRSGFSAALTGRFYF